MKHLVPYCRILAKTGRFSMKVSAFDDDAHPHGPVLRQEMVQAGLANVTGPVIRLTMAGTELVELTN